MWEKSYALSSPSQKKQYEEDKIINCTKCICIHFTYFRLIDKHYMCNHISADTKVLMTHVQGGYY